MSQPSLSMKRPREWNSGIPGAQKDNKAVQIPLDKAVRTYMIDPALNRSHQPLKVTAQHRQTSRIQQQPPACPLP